MEKTNNSGTYFLVFGGFCVGMLLGSLLGVATGINLAKANEKFRKEDEEKLKEKERLEKGENKEGE